MLRASRTEGRETPNMAESSRSGGNLSPGAKSPARMDSRIWSAIWLETFLGLIGWNFIRGRDKRKSGVVCMKVP